MIPHAFYPTPALPPSSDSELHVLVVARCPSSRATLEASLLQAGLHATATAAFGAVELLLGAAQPYDAVVVAQSLEESTLFGLPQLMRSFDADVPVLVLDHDTVGSSGVPELVQDAAIRWPLRERPCRIVH